MAKYLLDTNIVLGYLRAGAYAKRGEERFQLMTGAGTCAVSSVSIGSQRITISTILMVSS